eukprot:CAMPEP_0197529426 /NCGR_PEP_ID=MMETSP1318-20131121/28374_1 /TAXON_ID=552666 /ORGANISM="Partenskyella glossopodia, Strain RCC365" /LENGTH=97 /DNA_ID=CAMNT_0043084883 /DNA_START=429 /DNA_END=722 /DNA_ORIENTATION=-
MEEGMELKDPRSGRLKHVSASDMEVFGEFSVRLTIHEGMNRQIRRMFATLANEVLELSRIEMGPLGLPDELAVGEAIALCDERVQQVYHSVDLKHPV